MLTGIPTFLRRKARKMMIPRTKRKVAPLRALPTIVLMCEVADVDAEANTTAGGEVEGESEGENENEGENEGEGEGEGEILIKTLGCV